MLQFEVIKHKEDFIMNHLIYFIPAAYFTTAFKILDQQYQKTIESLNTKSKQSAQLFVRQFTKLHISR